MTTKRVQRAAELRGIDFNGWKHWLNNMVGYGYRVRTPRGYFDADTLEGLYRFIMEFPRIPAEDRLY